MSGKTAEVALSERPPLHLLRGASLFLDFDGTLVQIASTPDGVRVSDGLRDLLSALDAVLEGRIVILSGRSADEINGLIHPLKLIVGGSHGLELVHPGAPAAKPQSPEAVDRAITALRSLLRDHDGVVIEEKPFGVAVHYRLAPEAERDCGAAVEQVAQRETLHIQKGKMVFELRIGGADKGTALQKVMASPLFVGTSPIVLGDDLTDEAAFAVARQLGGAGVLVGEPRETAATYRLDGVDESLAWLAAAAEALP
jgi:trehalose 6-phosphate phosphatase